MATLRHRQGQRCLDRFGAGELGPKQRRWTQFDS